MTEPPEGASAPWRRLDARMLLIHPLETLVRFLPALLAVFVARLGSDGDDRWELLALPVNAGLDKYLSWINSETSLAIS